MVFIFPLHSNTYFMHFHFIWQLNANESHIFLMYKLPIYELVISSWFFFVSLFYDAIRYLLNPKNTEEVHNKMILTPIFIHLTVNLKKKQKKNMKKWKKRRKTALMAFNMIYRSSQYGSLSRQKGKDLLK